MIPISNITDLERELRCANSDLREELKRLTTEAVAADVRIENDALVISGLTKAVEEQRAIIAVLNAAVGCATTSESISVLDERDRLRAALAERDCEIARVPTPAQRAVMQQALDALSSDYILGCGVWREQRDAAITALKEALK